MHYHIIPAPTFGPSSESSTPVNPKIVEVVKSSESRIPHSVREMHQMEFESREELDEDDGSVLVQAIKARL